MTYGPSTPPLLRATLMLLVVGRGSWQGGQRAAGLVLPQLGRGLSGWMAPEERRRGRAVCGWHAGTLARWHTWVLQSKSLLKTTDDCSPLSKAGVTGFLVDPGGAGLVRGWREKPEVAQQRREQPLTLAFPPRTRPPACQAGARPYLWQRLRPKGPSWGDSMPSHRICSFIFS